MTFISYLPFISSVVSFAFAVTVLERYINHHRRPHLLLWGIGMIFYGISGLIEGLHGAFGWNPLGFRLWYLFGAILVAAWLGQGTVYLLAQRRLAHALMILLGLGSLFAVWRVFGATLDPSLMTGGELSGHAITSGGVRILTPFFNLYGTIALVGGAIWSAWLFWRKRVLLHRTIGNILIAIGAMSPAFGGAFSRFGLGGALYISELLGAIIMFIGFLRTITPMGESLTAPAAASAE